MGYPPALNPAASSSVLLDMALANRDRIAAKMSPEQIAEAEKLAREWKPKKSIECRTPSSIGTACWQHRASRLRLRGPKVARNEFHLAAAPQPQETRHADPAAGAACSDLRRRAHRRRGATTDLRRYDYVKPDFFNDIAPDQTFPARTSDREAG
jgi:hypothetical protein